MNDVLIVVPAFNEEKNIGSVIEDIRNNFPSADLIVINDCSTDATLSVLKKYDVQYINLPYNMGYSASLQTGFKYAKLHNYKYVIQFDGDGQHLALEANKLYDAILKNKSDIVIGSRFINKSDYYHQFFRRIGTKMFMIIIKLLCGIIITDPTSGFQILNEKTYSFYSLPFNFPEYPDANLIVKMLQDGYSISEISCKMETRNFGSSMHSGIIKPIKYIVKTLYSILLIILFNSTRKFAKCK